MNVYVFKGLEIFSSPVVHTTIFYLLPQLVYLKFKVYSKHVLYIFFNCHQNNNNNHRNMSRDI